MEAQRKARLYGHQRQNRIQVPQAEPGGNRTRCRCRMQPASRGQSWRGAHSRARGDCEAQGLPGFPSPPRFSPSPRSALPAQSCLRIKSSPKLAPSMARAAACPSRCRGCWAPSSQGSSQSGTQLLRLLTHLSVAQQGRPAPCQPALDLVYPPQGAETSCSCSSARMGPSPERRREPTGCLAQCSASLREAGGCGKALGVVGPEPHPAWTCLCPGERSPT